MGRPSAAGRKAESEEASAAKQQAAAVDGAGGAADQAAGIAPDDDVREDDVVAEAELDDVGVDDDDVSEEVEAAMLELMRVAEGRVAAVLYPRPESLSDSVYQSAISELAARGLAHAGPRPNLTREGVELARELIAEGG